VEEKKNPGGSHNEICQVRKLYIDDLSANRLKKLAPKSTSALASRGTIHSTHITIIISGGSGKGQARHFFDAALACIIDAVNLKSVTKVYETSSAQSITEITRNNVLPVANEGHDQVIILLSGDGGVNDVVDTLYRSRRTEAYCCPVIVPIPLGTGNALATSYGYLKGQTMGLSALLQGKRMPLPVFKISISPQASYLINEGQERVPIPAQNAVIEIWGAVVCSWGLHASLVANSDSKHYRQFGAERFRMAATELLYPSNGSNPHQYKGRVQYKTNSLGEWISADRSLHSYILVTLVSQLEKGFLISPASTEPDNMLRLVEIPDMSGDEIMSIMDAAYAHGQHTKMNGVGYHEITALKIHFQEEDEEWRRICVDGKIIEVGLDGTMTLEMEKQGLVDIIVNQ